MSQSLDSSLLSSRFTRALIYAALMIFAVYYLLPLFVMLTNSLKTLDEIRAGNMLALPRSITIEPWQKAWDSAQIGVDPSGLKPYFMNSVLMVIPAVLISTMLGAINGYILTKWNFRGAGVMFGLMLFSCVIPVSYTHLRAHET